MDVREKLVELLSKYFDIGDSYCYNLTRTKNAFACGTMGFDDFEEFDDETVADIADHLIAHGVTVQEWYSASNPPKEDGTYLVQTNTGTITTARFYAFKSFPATKYLPACHRSPSWQSNRNVVKWTFLPQPPKGE